MARSFSVGNTLLVGNPAALQITGTDFTAAAFCHPTSLPAAGVQQVIAKRSTNITSIAYELGFWNQKLRFALSDLVSAYDLVESGVLGATPGPVWVIGIKQGGSIRCYVNSSTPANSAVSNTDIHNSTATVRIGRQDDGNDFVGRIAEAAIWAKAISAAEIDALLKGVSPLFIRRNFLRGYWPIYAAGSPEADLSGNINNASLVGTPAAAAHPSRGRLAMAPGRMAV